MSRVVQEPDTTSVYLLVFDKWYRYDTDQPPIGEGGMGVVYQGFSCDTNDPVAIKKIHPELCEIPMIRMRAKLEASLIIDHPNLIRMIGYCEEEEDTGPLYVLSQFVSGITIDAYMRECLSRISSTNRERKIVEVLIPIIDAVSCLHERGIIHRDIKPSNIMVQDGYLPQLMDLGVAKADYFFDAHLLGTVGSPPYAAPEQIVAQDVEAVIDERSDIYSLGVTLSTLLDELDLDNKIGRSEEIQEIITRATQKCPDDRFASADQFKEALISYLYDEEIHEDRNILLPVVAIVSACLMVLLTLILFIV